MPVLGWGFACRYVNQAWIASIGYRQVDYDSSARTETRAPSQISWNYITGSNVDDASHRATQ